MRRFIIAAISLAYVCACSKHADDGDIPDPEIASVSPAEKPVDETRDIEIKGLAFLPKVTRQLSGQSNFSIDKHFEVRLHAARADDAEAFSLVNVTYKDDETLGASVPSNIPPGVYDLTVVTPNRLSHTKPQAFTVTVRNDSDIITDTETQTGIETETPSDTAARAPKRISLTFDNSAQQEALEMFPVLVILKPSRVDYDDFSHGGTDIRFFDADKSTMLPHEIENWNADGENYIWVRVPRIDGHSNTDHIWMYYGDNSLAVPPHPKEVWASDYQAVYHLSSMGESSGQLPSSSSPTNYGTTDVADGLSHAQHFDGRQNYIRLGNNLPLLENVSACTLSAWVRPNAFQTESEAYVIGISIETDAGSTFYSRAALLIKNNTKLTLVARSIGSEDMRSIESDSAAIQTGKWNHLVGVIDYAGNRLTTYVNGALVGEGTVDFVQPYTANAPARTAVLGTQEDQSGAWFGGDLDEVRIAKTARSADWAAAEHLTLRDEFITYGDPESD